jgi:hypothetical protein
MIGQNNSIVAMHTSLGITWAAQQGWEIPDLTAAHFILGAQSKS